MNGKERKGEWSVDILSVAALHKHAMGGQLCRGEVSCWARFSDGVDRYALGGGDRVPSSHCMVEG